MTRIQDQKRVRATLVSRLYRELVGPKAEGHEREIHEELTASPLSLYGAGILFPKKALQDTLEDSTSPEPEIDSDESVIDLTDPVQIDAGQRQSNFGADSAKEDPALNLANEFSPSAIGITFRTRAAKHLLVQVSGGRYAAIRKTLPHSKAGQNRRDGSKYPDTFERTNFRRTPILQTVEISLSSDKLSVQRLQLDNPNDALRLHVTTRAKEDDSTIVSVMAVNDNQCLPQNFPDPEDAFFQVCLSVREKNQKAVFQSVDRPIGNIAKGEQESLELQYRHRKSFALGHGCAGAWEHHGDSATADFASIVKSEVLPTYEVLPIRPRETPFALKGVNLSMSFLAGMDSQAGDDIRGPIAMSLIALCDDYSVWIDRQEESLSNVDPALQEVGKRNIEKCKACCNRMRLGIELLIANPDVFLAFRLANRAMLMQQFHHGYLKSRDLDSAMPVIPEGYQNLPGAERRWRPFQLAFVLMNLTGACDNENADRELVDLIWFPTGGGKTEAYLGLAAFSICLRRLRKNTDAGTSVIMRYTLRLLTAQQFERASALILALDVLRQENCFGADLGSLSITIGLWVGQGLSPNSRAQARAAVRALRKPNSFGKNPFQILECPWCKSKFDDKSRLGYAQERVAAGEATKTIVFRCTDSRCRWGATDARLPVCVIDEDMYDNPPTLLIGTVDKFAQIAWSDKVGRFFGIGTEYSPPALIIQDELHLISGPLGTIVGLYETAIERLCTRNDSRPKIVASTATIRSAGEQCKALYNRDFFEFPPPGLVAGESYFAYEDEDSPGRLYAGVFGSGLKSHATAQVRACSALLQGIMEPYSDDAENEIAVKDPYGTAVWYFNSLRELGHALTLCTGDIPEHIKGMCKRLDVPHKLRRRVRDVIELTSRRTADEIPKILRALNRQWRPNPDGRYPVDILLATNMISVGVDVSRLGLMVVTGQPKTTSEYIQATSRVGRACPGLVVTVYNQSKSRDRSHFERFNAYHQSLYRFVEPTSVTPFASPTRDRGLRGLFVALARLSAGISSPDQAQNNIGLLREEIEAILARVGDVDGEEASETREELETALEKWCQLLPSEYGKMGGTPSTSTLVFPFGSTPHPVFQDKSWPIMTSMRNVDQNCEARVVSTYGNAGTFNSEDD